MTPNAPEAVCPRRSEPWAAAWGLHNWPALIVWLLLLYGFLAWAQPRLTFSAWWSYGVRPLLWLATGALALFQRRRAEPGAALPFDRQLVLAAVMAAGLQSALYVFGIMVDGYRGLPYAARLTALTLGAWSTAAQLVGVELVRWHLYRSLERRYAWLGILLAWLVPGLLQFQAPAHGGLRSPAAFIALVTFTLLPAAATGLLATYLSVAGGPFASLAYRGTLAAMELLLPIEPRLRWVTATLLALGGPLIGWLIMSDRLEQRRLNKDLEEGIAARTAELSQANRLLQGQIAERLRMEEKLRQRNRELMTLNAIAAAVGGCLEPARLVAPLEPLLREALGVQAGALYIRDGSRLSLQASWGLPAEALADLANPPAAPLLAALAEPLTAEAAAGLPAAPHLPVWRALGPALARRPGWENSPALPLRMDGRLWGLVCLFGPDSSRWGEGDTAFYSALAGQIGAAMHNAHLYEEVRVARERLQGLSRRLVEAQEAERLHIARELHDEAGQVLTTLALSLSPLEQAAGDPEAVHAHVAQLRQLADATLQSLHRLATDLRPASLDHAGLIAALRQYLRSIEDQHGLEVHFEAVNLAAERLPPATETALFRIVQEALTNVLRHATATRADVVLERHPDRLLLIVEDDGVGFDLQETAKSSRLGLVGMRERAEMLGGTLTIDTAPGSGTTVVVEVRDGDSHPGG